MILPIIQNVKRGFALLAALTLLAASTQAISNAEKPTPLGRDLSFRKLEVLKHTSIGDVFALEQCHRGFIWFGSTKGIYRYDGYRLKGFHNETGNDRSLASNEVFDIHRDRKNRLWIGSYHGISLYQPKTETFKNYLSNDRWENKTLSNRVNVIQEDNNGRLLASTESGFIFYLDEAKDRFLPINTTPFGFIKSMTMDPYNGLWIGSDLGVFHLNIETNQTQFFENKLGAEEDVINNYINAVAYLDDEHIWLGTSSNGVAILNSLTGTIEALPVKAGDQYINQLAVVSEDNILAISNGSIILYDWNGNVIQRISSESENGEVPTSGITTYYSDSYGNHWLGSHWDGIAMSTVHKHFQKLFLPEYPPDAPVAALLKDKNGNLWVGDSRSGLHVYPADGSPPLSYINNPEDENSISAQPILKIFEDSRGTIWLGTFRGGLYRYLPETDSFIPYLINNDDPYAINSQDIRDLKEDEKGNLWINSHGGGIDYLNIETGRFTNFSHSEDPDHSIIDNWGYSIAYDNESRLWVGTTAGVSVINTKDGSINNYHANESNPRSLTDQSIMAIFVDSKGRIWLGSKNGLNLFVPETNDFDTFYPESGFPFKNIKSIIEDDNGLLWIGTADKLVRFDPETHSAKKYSSTDGLASDDFFTGSVFKDANGIIYFGQTRGITTFDPADIHDNTTPPKPVITNLLVFNEALQIVENSNEAGVLERSIIDTKSIDLNYDQKVISFEFTGLSYIQSHKNKYSYFLEGFDKDWNAPTSRRDVTYTNLNPGTYTFRVKAANNDGYWSKNSANIVVNILPPFWKTSWFIALVLFTGITLPSFLVYWRIDNIKKTKQALEKAVEERTQQLNTAVKDRESAYNQILTFQKELEATVKKRTRELEIAKIAAEQSDLLKSAFLANMSHEIRTPMNAIVGFLDFLEEDDLTPEERVQYRKIINQNSQSLLALIDDILDLSRIEAGEVEIVPEPINIHDFCEDLHALSSSSTTIESKVTVYLEKKTDNSPPNQRALLDPLRVRQILLNLLSNALKFTEEGEIIFGYKITPPSHPDETGEVVFKVKDSGIGIPKSQLKYIFNRFHKIEKQADKLYRGTGLGLTISKKLVDLMDGQIEVISTEGVGTEFTVTLPFYTLDKPKDTLQSVHSKTTTSLQELDLRAFTVLVAEDESPNFEYIKKILSRTRINVIWARNGIETMELFKTNSIDILLLDLKMPKMDGYQVTNAIRKIDVQIPILIQTAYAMTSDKLEVMNAGASDYISKPFSATQLLQLIEKHLPLPSDSKNN